MDQKFVFRFFSLRHDSDWNSIFVNGWERDYISITWRSVRTVMHDGLTSGTSFFLMFPVCSQFLVIRMLVCLRPEAYPNTNPLLNTQSYTHNLVSYRHTRTQYVLIILANPSHSLC